MRSYIRINGPPILEGIKALEKIAIDAPEVCIMNTFIASFEPNVETDPILAYFNEVGDVTAERCGKIISQYSEMLGDYDFFFEWFKDPDPSELHDLMEKIDLAFAEIGCRYSITTK